MKACAPLWRRVLRGTIVHTTNRDGEHRMLFNVGLLVVLALLIVIALVTTSAR